MLVSGGCTNRDENIDDMNIPSIPENRDDSNDDMNIPSIPENIEGLTLFVKSDLAQRLGVVINDIDVCSITEVEWNDTSLGCPQEDMMYFAPILLKPLPLRLDKTPYY
jgi:hypothetical protein